MENPNPWETCDVLGMTFSFPSYYYLKLPDGQTAFMEAIFDFGAPPRKGARVARRRKENSEIYEYKELEDKI